MRVLASSTSELLELVNSRAHPFVVGFRFALMDASFAYIGMHHVGGGDLFSVLQQHGPFPPDGAKIYVAEVVLALAHLHSFDVVHQDVKVSVTRRSTKRALPSPRFLCHQPTMRAAS